MVRLKGDEAFILAVVEVIKVAFVAILISCLAFLDVFCCMFSLRKHGEVTMYDNDIARAADKTFGHLWKSLISIGQRKDVLDKETWAAIKERNLRRSAKAHKSSGRVSLLSVRTVLFSLSIVVSCVDVAVLFALSTEGKNVADKPEFALRSAEASEVLPGTTMEFYNPHEAQIRYEYVVRRLGWRMLFRNGSEFTVEVPRRLDPALDEKWNFGVALPEEEIYATVYVKDFISEEKAKFYENIGQVSGTTESGKTLVHYRMARRDIDRNACSGSIGGAIVDEENDKATLCYTDELRDMSCKDREDGEEISFKMACSEIRVQRFGGNVVPRNDNLWWLVDYANGASSTGKDGLMQLNSLRGYKRDPVSPSSMIVASVLTEHPSQVLLLERPFAIDVSVVIIPNWLLISSFTVVGVMILLSLIAAIYTIVKNLVVLTNWRDMLVANLIEPLDCLNRSNRKSFQCIIGESSVPGKMYHLYVEPEDEVTPVKWVKRKEIVSLAPGPKAEAGYGTYA